MIKLKFRVARGPDLKEMEFDPSSNIGDIEKFVSTFVEGDYKLFFRQKRLGDAAVILSESKLKDNDIIDVLPVIKQKEVVGDIKVRPDEGPVNARRLPVSGNEALRVLEEMSNDGKCTEMGMDEIIKESNIKYESADLESLKDLLEMGFTPVIKVLIAYERAGRCKFRAADALTPDR